MKDKTKHILILLALMAVLVMPYFVFAEIPSPLDRMDSIQEASGYEQGSETTFAEIVGTVVMAFLSLLGVIFIILMLYGGFKWMTAAGDEEKVRTAGKIIRRAIIGLIITVGSYAIATYVLGQLISV